MTRIMSAYEIDLRLKMCFSDESFRRELRKIAEEIGEENRKKLLPYLAHLINVINDLDGDRK